MKNKLIVCLLCGLMSASFTAAKKPGFAVWQLCAQGPSQMNSYVFVTDRGRGNRCGRAFFARIRGRPGQPRR